MDMDYCSRYNCNYYTAAEAGRRSDRDIGTAGGSRGSSDSDMPAGSIGSEWCSHLSGYSRLVYSSSSAAGTAVCTASGIAAPDIAAPDTAEPDTAAGGTWSAVDNIRRIRNLAQVLCPQR